MSLRARQRIAVGGCAVAGIAIVIGIAIELLTWTQGTLTSSIVADLALMPVCVLMGYLGLLITIRRPENRIGWLLGVVAFLTGLIVLSDGYATRMTVAAPGSLPGGAGVAWLSDWIWVPVVFGLLIYLPLVFPTGVVQSATLRWVMRVVILQMTVLGLGLAFRPGELDGYAIDNPFGITTPGNLFAWLTRLGFVLGFPCLALAATAIIETLQTDLSVVVQTTMEPAHVSLWLRGGR